MKGSNVWFGGTSHQVVLGAQGKITQNGVKSTISCQNQKKSTIYVNINDNQHRIWPKYVPKRIYGSFLRWDMI